jgi:hypothetical protein
MQIIKLTPYENTLLGGYIPGSEVIVLLDTSAAGFTVVLPDAHSSQGTKFTMVTIGVNDAIIEPMASQLINSGVTITLIQYENVGLSAFNGKYYIVKSKA